MVETTTAIVACAASLVAGVVVCAYGWHVVTSERPRWKTEREKWLSLLQSRRFRMAVIGVLTVVLQEKLGLTEKQAYQVLAVLGTWAGIDTIRKTE